MYASRLRKQPPSLPRSSHPGCKKRSMCHDLIAPRLHRDGCWPNILRAQVGCGLRGLFGKTFFENTILFYTDSYGALTHFYFSRFCAMWCGHSKRLAGSGSYRCHPYSLHSVSPLHSRAQKKTKNFFRSPIYQTFLLAECTCPQGKKLFGK